MDDSGASVSACESGVRVRGKVEVEEEKPSGVRERDMLEGMLGIVGPRKRCLLGS